MSFEEAAKLFNDDGVVMIRDNRLKLCLGHSSNELVEAFACTVECGSIVKHSHGITTLYAWNLFGRTEVVSLLERMLPYLTGRRKEMAEKALNPDLWEKVQ